MRSQSAAVPRSTRRHARQLLVRLDRAVLDVAISVLLAAIERVMRRRIAQRAIGPT